MKKYLKLEVWIDENMDDAKECADGTVNVEVVAKNENI